MLIAFGNDIQQLYGSLLQIQKITIEKHSWNPEAGYLEAEVNIMNTLRPGSHSQSYGHFSLRFQNKGSDVHKKYAPSPTTPPPPPQCLRIGGYKHNFVFGQLFENKRLQLG